jgi:THO complex subunit 7
MDEQRLLIDQIILARITNDERHLKRVIKKFHNYTSHSHSPVVPTVPAGTSADDAREAFLVELATFQLALKKSVMICEAEARQVEEYQREKRRIGE